jgi:hypothetical protein
MQRNRLMSGLAVAALALYGSAMANEIYKWTDADGTVHYRDRPTGESSEVRLDVAYSRTDRSTVEQRQQSFAESQARRAESRAAADEAAREAETEAQAAAEKQKKCDGYRQSLQRYNEARRLYKEGPDGERTYLDDDEMLKARQQLEDHIAENCRN